MLTEKGIKDFAWCPTLFKDTEGNSKRVKDDRKDDPTWDLIREAADTGEPNRKCYVERGIDYIKITSYDERGIWLVAQAGDETSILCNIDQVFIQSQTCKIRRKQRATQNTDLLYAEKMIRQVLQVEFDDLFPELEVIVETITGMNHSDQTGILLEDEVKESFRYMEEIKRSSEGDMHLSANTERCGFCWWKACPYKLALDEDKLLASDGDARMEML